MTLSVLFLILLVAVNLFFITTKPVLVISTMIAAIIVPLLFMSDYAYATPSDLSYYVMASICHRIYLGMTGFSIMAGAAMAFPLEGLKRYGKALYGIVLWLFAVTIFVYGFIYIKEREDIWRKQGDGYEETVKGIKSYKHIMSPFYRIYLIGDHVSFMQPMFRLYFNNSDLIVEVIDNKTKITDPEAGVLEMY